jgi:hypothetical protein
MAAYLWKDVGMSAKCSIVLPNSRLLGDARCGRCASWPFSHILPVAVIVPVRAAAKVKLIWFGGFRR